MWFSDHHKTGPFRCCSFLLAFLFRFHLLEFGTEFLRSQRARAQQRHAKWYTITDSRIKYWKVYFLFCARVPARPKCKHVICSGRPSSQFLKNILRWRVLFFCLYVMIHNKYFSWPFSQWKWKYSRNIEVFSHIHNFHTKKTSNTIFENDENLRNNLPVFPVRTAIQTVPLSCICFYSSQWNIQDIWI